MSATKNFKKYWLHPFWVFPAPINNKSFELNLQLPNHYKNALKVRLKSVELFSTSNLTHSATTLTFQKKKAISLTILTNTVFIKNCFAQLRSDFRIHKTRFKSYSLDPSEPISIFILNFISKRFHKFFFFT